MIYGQRFDRFPLASQRRPVEIQERTSCHNSDWSRDAGDIV
jgi:hypothetical protein